MTGSESYRETKGVIDLHQYPPETYTLGRDVCTFGDAVVQKLPEPSLSPSCYSRV